MATQPQGLASLAIVAPLVVQSTLAIAAAVIAEASLSFLGLGVMGGAIARHIGAAGHRLTIYNRSPERAARWQEANPGLAARVAASPAEAAEGTIRKLFAESKGKNAIHASDSDENAVRESRFFFAEAEVV